MRQNRKSQNYRSYKMDVQLYKRIEEVVANMTTLEESQNAKLDEIQKELKGIKSLLLTMQKPAQSKVEEKPKTKVK